MFKKTLVCIAILSPFSANAVVCTDPTGLGQIISQSAQDAMLWAEEKGMALTEMSMTELMEKWKASQDTTRVLAQTQALSTTASETANLQQQAKMEPSPLMCDGINSVVGIYESLDDFYCETSNASLDFAEQLTQEASCEEGRCNSTQQTIADEAVKLFEEEAVNGGDVDMSKMNISGLLPGLGEAGYSKSPEEKERIDTLIKVLFNPGNVRRMPTGANGERITSDSSPEAIRSYNRWLKDYLRTTAGFNTAKRVSGLTDPRDHNGQKVQSVLEQIKKDIDFYNSDEQIKLYGNGGDKSCFENMRFQLKTQKEMEIWLNSPSGQACKKQFTTVEQVQRMTAQMQARNLSLMGYALDSMLSSEFNLAMQSQILNEILNNLEKKRF
ncbi:hypothetical protein F7Q91_03425 [Vibrio chagasii]|uniref:Uncharacterized protein n=1 Tax=Vibrio chagasii TaxID=170679 RepID=A0A7V7NX02_9VIBR|nr:hypothetical protein [Vibrio chagasii]KAB0482473.1 hypothetical protein F7Q91_03425 [Vibrio chagasii]